MSAHTIKIENLKCGGCASTIIKELTAISEVDKVEVDVENSLVSFFSEESKVEEVRQKLSKLGYPEEGTNNTIIHKAKSFVSCATGKMSK